jgi:hypothetical protein
VATAWTENVTYFNYCNEFTTPPDNEDPSYYCWALTVKGLLIAWWLWNKHTSPRGAFNKKRKVEFSNAHKNLKYTETKWQKLWKTVWSSKDLADNLVAKWAVRPKDSAAHHIALAGGKDENSVKTRKILEKYWIDINEAGNGAFLPRNKKVSCDWVCTHSVIHTKKYKENIFNRLDEAVSKEDVYFKLNIIRNELLNNKAIY